ncbi:hypothetical protein [[Mycobacterium] wendilense]|uniref:Prepilin type IV endopeptidase peptidase domain-containing protein n=1 Tax=[Mycobacterium] wendilense TaxID=3064284 RepID=A0ABM9M8W4_9MYCO|nr:hypothetical protein [Mycolicibacterium sp. MU0050]CAJ1579285.1 hypothetical protein MU0050_000431 [Mycolicibacterium sp. MU0050]
MSALAVFLSAIGLADICRKLTDRRWPALVAGPVVVLGCALLAGLWRFGDVVLLTFAAVAAVAWVRLSSAAERTGTGEGRALTVFGATVAVLLVLAGWMSPVEGLLAGWLRWVGLGDLEPERALMIFAVVLLQLVTANQLVRLILGAVGAVRPAGQPQPSDRLKGGRLLGPMERLLIVGLGLGGQIGAASAVVAAKGIIRFPELNAQRKDNGGSGIDEVTEYFLVGSFASWLIAMAGLMLALN